MKTNQIMLREEGFEQRTKDSYFNANSLINAYNAKNGTKKMLGNYMKNDATNEFIEQLKKEGIENPVITKRGQSENSGTWVHSKVFIDFAMWVSVEFKSKVIDFILDGLIKSRHDAGDYYKEMTIAILEKYVENFGVKPSPIIYINEANFIKSLVSIVDRNELSEQELRQITYLQKFNTMLINKNIGKESREKRLIEASLITI